jgi:1-acyl-sn-glycerol-3-phosphate acyltransferase
MSICIFPEGGVPDNNIELDKFMDGAFRMAINHQIAIVPLTFVDNKKRLSYIFFSGGPGVMRVIQHKFIETKGLLIDDTKRINNHAREIILRTLKMPS